MVQTVVMFVRMSDNFSLITLLIYVLFACVAQSSPIRIEVALMLLLLFIY